MKKSPKLQALCGSVVNSPSELETAKLSSLCIIHFIEPEAKKSKTGTKKNEKEAAGEGPVLYEDPPDQKTSPSGKSATLKICSWNVDGLRAWIKKKGLDVSAIQGREETFFSIE